MKKTIDNNEAIIIREYGADYNIRTESVLLVDAINSIDRQLKPWRETTPDEIREESFDMGSIISHLNQIDRHLKKAISWAESIQGEKRILNLLNRIKESD